MTSDGIKVGVLVRTKDEAHRIASFCRAYKDADLILVADGGSVDNTIEIAKRFPNVEVRNYPGRVQMLNGYIRNNDADHINWLIEWAKEYKFTFQILDDCDMLPNYLLRNHYRRILSESKEDFIMVTKLYLWGKEQHFPHMCKPGAGHDTYEPSLWAWRGNQDFYMVNVPPAFTFRIGNLDVKDLHFDAKTLDVFPPYCCLHFSWDNPERVEQKLKVYRESGLIPGQLHPLDFAGPLEPLPWWAHT